MTKITIIQGHPDRARPHFGHALADAYAEAAEAAGHEVRRIAVTELEFPVLTDPEAFRSGMIPPALERPARDLLWADHLVLFYPLWLGSMPAQFKAFLEQVLRPQDPSGDPKRPAWRRPLKNKSVRIVVTMGMPALVYRWYFGAHGLKNLRRNILAFVGAGPIRSTLIGMIESIGDAKRQRWLHRIGRLGARAH